MQNLSDDSVNLTFSHYWDKVASEIISYCLKHCDECGRIEFTFQDFARICGYSAEFLEDDFIDVMDYIDGLRFKTDDGIERDLIVSMKDQDEKFSLVLSNYLLIAYGNNKTT